MFRELLEWLLGIAVVAGSVVVFYQRRLSRAYRGYRRMEEYADTLLQQMQGTLLSVHGIVSELRSEDPVRTQMELMLDRADRQLAEIREQMQPYCSEQQDERIE